MKQIREAVFLGILIGLAAFGLYSFVQYARPGVSCSVPNQFSNGTTADATQVNANFAALVACFANSAAAGANSDITSLTGLTTPITAAAGGSTAYVGANSTGTNTIAVASAVPTGYALTKGNSVCFFSGASNTPGPVTLAVAGTTAKGVFRQNIVNGYAELVGGEIFAGTMTCVIYDGTQYILLTNYNPGLPGSMVDFAGSACPTGYAEANAQVLAQATYPTAFSVLGTIWGTPGGGNFSIPDLRGRTGFQRDTGGSGRITVAGGNCDGTTVGTTCGGQNQTLTVAQLPAAQPSGSWSFTGVALGHVPLTTTSWTSFGAGAGATQVAASGGTISDNNYTPSGTITTGNLGSGNAHTILSPAAIVLKCVKL